MALMQDYEQRLCDIEKQYITGEGGGNLEQLLAAAKQIEAATGTLHAKALCAQLQIEVNIRKTQNMYNTVSADSLRQGQILQEYAQKSNDIRYLVYNEILQAHRYEALGDDLSAFDHIWKAMEQLKEHEKDLDPYFFQVQCRNMQGHIASFLMQAKSYERAYEFNKKSVENLDFQNLGRTDISTVVIYYANSIICLYCLNRYEEAYDILKEGFSYISTLPRRSYLHYTFVLWDYMLSTKFNDKERIEEAEKQLKAHDFNSSALLDLEYLLDFLLEQGRYEETLYYLNRMETQAYHLEMLDMMVRTNEFKVKYYSAIGDISSREAAYRELGRLMLIQTEAKNKARASSLEAYIQVAGKSEQQRELEQARDMLKRKSEYDELTALPNRYKLTEFCQQAFERARAEDMSLCVEIIDVDFFKQINDNYGHNQGDICLKKLAAEIQKTIENPEMEIGARYGGDEFVIIRLDKTEAEILSSMEQLKQAVMDLGIPNEYSKAAKVLTISQGAVNKKPSPEEDLTSMMQMADECLYEAKKKSKNTVVLAP